MNQKQHIIPQVYIKRFGYQDKNGVWKVPTVSKSDLELMNKLDKNIVKQSNIESLLREQNLYDIPEFGDEKRKLEELLKLGEDNYNNVIDEIKKKNELSQDKKSKLIAFISLLLVRTKDFRLILEQIIKNKDHTYLSGVMKGNNKRIERLFEFQINSAINVLIALSGFYVFKLLQNFKTSIVKTIPEEKWATSDNPVLIKCKSDVNGRKDFMGMDTKIICPLSPDYLVFIDQKESKMIPYKDFDKLNENKINKISKESFEEIWKDLTVFERVTEYLILPTEKKE